MNSTRTVRALGCLALLAAAAAAPACARATSIALYPLEGVGVGRRMLSRLHRLLIDGAWQLADQGERFEPREPMLVPGACGSARAAKLECLGRLAAGGVLIVGDAERQGNSAIVTLRLVDGRGRVSPDAWFRMSSTVLATGPVAHALQELEAALVAKRLRRPSVRAEPSSGEADAPPEVLPGLREKSAPPDPER
jgi:hypothetical protein